MSAPDANSWPPPPQFSHSPPEAFRVGTVEVVQTPTTLTVMNSSPRRMLWVSWVIAVLYPVPFLSVPLFVPIHGVSGLRALKLFILFLYHREPATILALTIFPFIFLFQGWWGYNRTSHRGQYELDNRLNCVLLGGKFAYPLSKLQCVRIKTPTYLIPGQRYSVLNPNWHVSLLRTNPAVPQRKGRLPFFKTRRLTHIGTFRKEADAHRVAEAIADFAGVPVTLA